MMQSKGEIPSKEWILKSLIRVPKLASKFALKSIKQRHKMNLKSWSKFILKIPKKHIICFKMSQMDLKIFIQEINAKLSQTNHQCICIKKWAQIKCTKKEKSRKMVK